MFGLHRNIPKAVTKFSSSYTFAMFLFTSIGGEAFSGCSGLTSIEIPNSVTSIGYQAFKDCGNIETLYVSSSIESIGDEAFVGCDKITEIKIGLEKPISFPLVRQTLQS